MAPVNEEFFKGLEHGPVKHNLPHLLGKTFIVKELPTVESILDLHSTLRIVKL